MSLKRVYVNDDVAHRLSLLKRNTGLTPNLACRIGFCLSLAEPGIPDERLYSDTQAREFNRFTLTGQWDSYFFALLRERLVNDGLDPESDLEGQFKAHLSRGVLLMYQRVRNLEDLGEIIAKAHERFQAAGIEETVRI
jgi:DNA sulfur modification protein DndE